MPKMIQLAVPKRLPGLNEIIKLNKSLVPYLSKGKKRVYQYTITKKEIETYLVKLFLIQTKGEAGKSIKFNKVRIRFKWIECNRRRDPSNVCAGGRKFILDALVRCGILQNDNWLAADFIDEFTVCKNRPGVELIIEDL